MSGILVRALPVLISVAGLGVMAVAALSGSPVTRNPAFLAFPLMMVVSAVVTGVTGRGRSRGAEIGAARVDYLAYLSRLREAVAEIIAAQHLSLRRAHPDPEALWTVVGGSRMWERRPGGPDFGHIRVGLGSVPLATPLVAPQNPPERRVDPVTRAALHRFLRAHSALADVPISMSLWQAGAITIDGEVSRVRGLLRAMVCQLAVWHPPDRVSITADVGEENQVDWEWLKWLPHNQSRDATHVVMIVDGAQDAGAPMADRVTLRVGAGHGPMLVRCDGRELILPNPDYLGLVEATVCARRLAAHQSPRRGAGCGWPSLLDIDEVTGFDPHKLWHGQDRRHRLRAPVGYTPDGTPVDLDIKESAEQGMGPHGLCVGATGSGKSELLRTIALGMMARNSPELLNLLLVDFKGGATFLDLARAPHVAAVITNLADEAPLVARMRDALAGEMNRRQQLLRAAGNFVSAAAYERARRGGAQLTALPTLFIIVDEFSELLSQHPDFADTFVAIGRLGRSLGIHLLLASQRLDEGRLRGLEAHLSYRICLKTLSAAESRAVLGTLDAYQLPNAPGAAFLRTANAELVRFQTAFVSGPLMVRPAEDDVVRAFTRVDGLSRADADADANAVAAPSLLHAVLDRLSGHGPPAHRVWLPPLASAPPLDALLDAATPGELVAPIGIVDRPFDQCRVPFVVELSAAAGNVAVVGAPRSGKSTALRTLIMALAASHDPGQVQFYCLDFGGGGLAALRELPHVGAVAGRAESQLVSRMIAELESVLRSREDSWSEKDIDSFAHVFLVIDGWAALRHEFEKLEESITALAEQGLSFGIHVVLSASRWAEIRPSLKDQIGTRIELCLGDPADSELDRRQAQHVPRGRPGRGLTRDGLHMHIAQPEMKSPIRRGDTAAPPIPLLPARVDSGVVVRQATEELAGCILLGIEERRLHPIAIDFECQSHLLVLGDNECGKTATLRMLCREIVRTRTPQQARLLIVDFRRALLGAVESEHVGGYAMSTASLGALLPDLLDLLGGRMPPPQVTQSQLRAHSWWTGPDIYLVVDDYDLVATASGNPLLGLLKYLPHARDLGLHVIAARRSGGAARAMFEPLLAGLRDFGCMALMMSGRPDEGTLFGSRPASPLPPGRGILIARPGDEQLVQVAWTP